jgi:hypothetical protein
MTYTKLFCKRRAYQIIILQKTIAIPSKIEIIIPENLFPKK